MSAAEVSTPDDRGSENINTMRALYSNRSLGKQFPSLEAWYGMMESAQVGEGTTEEAKKSNVAGKLEKHQQVCTLNSQIEGQFGGE
ncbi:40S ribosomal protein S8-like [Pyrus ussuriensis x Pyrus communis]|uniref:40S ribosomal protein S8-like n=1 Tax=Pyrus ussuriensis x Pyrus communis TaxID=2448454 RepID=A0A5N5H5K3_9ROSA|nr:40S ribosomal protein S8-like [Pyrus ussuriensis x Pyrus communis]